MHLALKSAMSRIPYTNKVGETLGSITDPTASYSLRALNGGDPMVARVRRSSDDAEKDFTASDVSGGALVDWVGSGNDGFVTSWYDQSGNDNHATQSTAGSQPKIVDGGVYLEKLDFDGVDDYLQNPDVVRAAPHTAFAVWSTDIITGIEVVADGIGSGFASALYRAADDANIYAGLILAGGVNLSPNDTILHYGLFNGANSETGVNGLTPVIGNAGGENPSGIRVGGSRSLAASQFFDGKVTEIIIYNSDQSANRAAIETNINNHYDIY